jgi:hypothetical protein
VEGKEKGAAKPARQQYSLRPCTLTARRSSSVIHPHYQNLPMFRSDYLIAQIRRVGVAAKL